MSKLIEQRAEVQRLARVLGTEPSRLKKLEKADPADLRALRDAISDHLLERDRGPFERAVALANVLPGPIAAKLAQHALGASLSARAASLLKPEQAADLARRLPPVFLADVAQHLDLRHAGRLLQGIPMGTLAHAGREIRRREDWVVLAAFVGYIEPEVLGELLDVFDGEALLRAGFVVEHTEALDAIVAQLSDARLDELLDAAHRFELWTEAISLVGHLSAEQGQRIVAALERQEAAALDRLAALLMGEQELRSAARPLIELAPAELRARIGE